MKHALVIFALLLALPICVYGQHDRRDGNWWKDKTQNEKLDYMVGFFDGMELGHQFSYWGMLKDSGNKEAPCISDMNKSYGDYGTKYFTNVTNYQLVDGLDSFYKDYRNRSIKVHDAVWLVVNSIAGTPQKELDKMIENWRRTAATRD